MVTDCQTEKPKQPQLIKASEMLEYLVREHNEKQARQRKIIKIRTKKTKKPTGVLQNAMQEDQKGCRNMYQVFGPAFLDASIFSSKSLSHRATRLSSDMAA